MQDHHYFVSHALGWATGPTLEGTIQKLWSAQHTDVRKWLLNTHKDGGLGLNFFACRVPLPENAEYQIEWYLPVVDGLTETANYILTYYTQKGVKYAKDPSDETRVLRARYTRLADAIREHGSYHCPEVRQEIVDAGFGTKEEKAELAA